MGEIPGINQEHRKPVEINPAKEEVLTAFNDEFLIPKITDGQDVKVGGGLSDGDFYIRCNFSDFDDKLKVVTPEKLEELFVGDGKLEQSLPDFDEDTRRLLNICWRTARISKSMLSDVGSETKRNDSFSEYKTKTANGKKVCVKPLSKCRGQAVCAEYSLMAQHILDKLGIQASVVVGAFAENPDDQLAGRPTYLVLESGKYVFDPTHSAQQEGGWPPKVFTPETPLTVESLRNMGTDDTKPFGKKIKCTDLLTKENKIYGTGAT